MCTQKMRALSHIGAEKITFPPKPDRQTYGRTDFSIYRVAFLLKREIWNSKKVKRLSYVEQSLRIDKA